MDQRGSIWIPILLIIVGIWVVAQALAGDLGGRILSWGPK